MILNNFYVFYSEMYFFSVLVKDCFFYYFSIHVYRNDRNSLYIYVRKTYKNKIVMKRVHEKEVYMKDEKKEIYLVEEFSADENVVEKEQLTEANLVPIKAMTMSTMDLLPSVEVLNLHSNMDRWAIYRCGVLPVKGNEFAYVTPKQWGGLSYVCRPGAYQDVVEIQTQQFGYVQIYAPRDQDSCRGGGTLTSPAINDIIANPDGNFSRRPGACYYRYEPHN